MALLDAEGARRQLRRMLARGKNAGIAKYLDLLLAELFFAFFNELALLISDKLTDLLVIDACVHNDSCRWLLEQPFVLSFVLDPVV